MIEIADVLYGRIKVDEVEKIIIDHPYFQRLRRIKHLGFLSLVFPSANHTRFEHSLGTMYLAEEYFRALLQNTDKIVKKYGGQGAFPEVKERCEHASEHLKLLKDAQEELIQIIRLSALLHDIGHGPFSHVFEKITPSWKEIKEKGQKGEELIKLKPDDKAENKTIKHEQYSVAIVKKLLEDKTIKDALREKSIDCDKFYSFFWYVIGSGKCSDGDLEKLCSGKKLPVGTAKILNSILSGIIDVDRMDFLYRDSHHAGVKYGIFDIDRLKESLVIWPETKTTVQLAIRSSGVSSLEHYLFCLYQMYLQIYSHRTENAANAMLMHVQRECKGLLEDYFYDIEKYCELDDVTYVKKLAELSRSNGKINSLLIDLFEKRKLWKRVLEVDPAKDGISPASIKEAIVNVTEDFEEYECGRDLLKGLRLGKENEGDALLVLTRELKYGEPRLSNLRNVSELCMLFSGRKYSVYRYYSPEDKKDEIRKCITEKFVRRKISKSS